MSQLAPRPRPLPARPLHLLTLVLAMPSARALALAAAGDNNAPAAPINGEDGDPSDSRLDESPPSSSYGDNTPTTSDILLFVGFMVFVAALIAGIWIYVRRRRRAARAKAAAEADDLRWHGDMEPPVYVQPAFFPMRPLRKDRREVERGGKTGHGTLGRTLSTSSTATAVSKDEQDEVPRLESPARPPAAHRSSWRGRFGRIGDHP